MTLRLHENTRFIGRRDKRVSGVFGRHFPAQHGDTRLPREKMPRLRLYRPLLQQEPCRFLGTRDDAMLSDIRGLDGNGLGPSFRVHGAAPRGVAA